MRKFVKNKVKDCTGCIPEICKHVHKKSCPVYAEGIWQTKPEKDLTKDEE
jgi:hypothetical protein